MKPQPKRHPNSRSNQALNVRATPLTINEIEKAHRLWGSKTGMQKLDEDLQNLNSTGARLSRLKSARMALQLSYSEMGRRLNLTRAAIASFEKSEAEGSITLANLKRLADAMDCNLVYTLKPKASQSFAREVWNRILPTALRHPWLKNCAPQRKAEALAFIARELLNDTVFRRNQNWSQRVTSTTPV